MSVKPEQRIKVDKPVVEVSLLQPPRPHLAARSRHPIPSLPPALPLARASLHGHGLTHNPHRWTVTR